MDRLAPAVAILVLAGVVVLAVRQRTADPAPSPGPTDAAAAAGAPGAGPDGSRADAISGKDGEGGAPPDSAPAAGAPAGSDTAPGRAGPVTAEAGPEVTIERRRYAVSGSTARELRSSLREQGRSMEGRTAFAWTEWTVDVGYEYRRSGDECRVVRPEVDVGIVVYLPEWRDRGEVSADLVGRWRRDLATMEEHEAGHVELARRAGERVDSALAQMDPAPCALLKDRADAVADAILREARQEQDTYDERTDHGGRQHLARPRP